MSTFNKLKEHIGETVSCTYVSNIEENKVYGELKDTNDSYVLVGSICLPLEGKILKVTKIRSIDGKLYYSNISYNKNHSILNAKKALLKKVK